MCRINRRGAAAVEFALVAPVFFLMVFGMIEFGRMIMVQQVITNGSREGARLAVLDDPVPGTQTARIKQAVVDYLHGGGIGGAVLDDVDVDPDPPSSAGYGAPVTVTVTIPFGQVSWLPSPMFIGGGTVLTASSVMRRETVQ